MSIMQVDVQKFLKEGVTWQSEVYFVMGNITIG